jgi:hypothetical protein
MAGHTCEDCLAFELDMGAGEEVLAARGRAAELWAVGMGLEADAIAELTHNTYATARRALLRFMAEDLSMAAPEEALEAVLPPRGRRDEGETLRREENREGFWKILYMFAASAPGKWKASTIGTYLDGVAAVFRDRGVAVGDCPTKHRRIKQLLKGFRRRSGESVETAVRRALAMDEELLFAIITDLMGGRMKDVKGTGIMTGFEARQAAIALLLGWAGLARRSELAGLWRSRWRVEEGSLVVEWSGVAYRRAKSDANMTGQASVLPEVVMGWPLAQWMRDHDAQLEKWGVGPDEPFFRNVGRPKSTAWAESGEAVNRLLRRVTEQSSKRHGLAREVERYSSHSMRRGGAQFLRDNGISRELIKVMGRWRSDAVDAYLDTVAAKAKKKVSKVFRFLGAKA